MCPICPVKTEGHRCCSEKCFKIALKRLGQKSLDFFNFIAENHKEVKSDDGRT